MPLYEVFTKGGSMGQPTDIVELLPNDTSKGAWPQTTGTFTLNRSLSECKLLLFILVQGDAGYAYRRHYQVVTPQEFIAAGSLVMWPNQSSYKVTVTYNSDTQVTLTGGSLGSRQILGVI